MQADLYFTSKLMPELVIGNGEPEAATTLEAICEEEEFSFTIW